MLKKSFKIDSALYSNENIMKMVEDFSDFSVSFNDWILDIEWANDIEINQIFWECMNYVIALYNENI